MFFIIMLCCLTMWNIINRNNIIYYGVEEYLLERMPCVTVNCKTLIINWQQPFLKRKNKDVIFAYAAFFDLTNIVRWSGGICIIII
jgi:hypothetical protein